MGGSDGQAPLPAHWEEYNAKRGIPRDTVTYAGGMSHFEAKGKSLSFNTNKLGDMNVCACKQVTLDFGLLKEGQKSRKHWDTCLHGWFMYYMNPQQHKLEPTPQRALDCMMTVKIDNKAKRKRAA